MCVMYDMNKQKSAGIWNVLKWDSIMDAVSSNIRSLLPPWLPGSIVNEAINFAIGKIDINGTIEGL